MRLDAAAAAGSIADIAVRVLPQLAEFEGDLHSESDFYSLDYIHHQEAEFFIEHVQFNNFGKLGICPSAAIQIGGCSPAYFDLKCFANSSFERANA